MTHKNYGMTIVPGTITALSPCHHGGNDKTGSTVNLNRQKWIVDGEPADIPYISGNSIRGVLRRLLFRDMLRRLNHEIDVSNGGGRRLYHALFSGGTLEQARNKDAGFNNLELKRRIYDLMPPARLFGFAFGNQLLEGTLKVGQILPVCTELADFIPAELKPRLSVFSLIAQRFHTRKDDLVNAERDEGEASHQMLVDYEIFVAGTVFYHDFRLEDATSLDKSTLAAMLDAWQAKPYLGAKSATGLGQVRLSYQFGDNTAGEYYQFLETNAKDIGGLLNELSS